MKKRLAKSLAFLMAIVTIFSISGCAGGGGKGKNNAKVENNCYETGLPIAEETVKLTVMVKDYGTLVDYNDAPITEWIKENLNVEIEWISVPGGWEVNNQATLSFVSDNMPDIMMGMAPLGYEFYWEYILEGKVQDLTPYITKYGKNIVQMFKDVPLAEYLCTGYDGNVYMLPMVRDYDENDTGQMAGALYINQTWLDNLGLQMPTTTKEFKEVLKAFKTSDPNGNGVQDEIPLDLPEELPNGLYGPFGMSIYNTMWYIDDNDQLHYAPIEDDYRRALTYYRDMYQEGLIGKDFYNQTNADIMKKVNGTIPTVGCFASSDVLSHLDPERAEEYVVVPPLSDELGNCTWTNQHIESMWPDWFVVTSQCKYPEIAVRLADYFYSLEGSITALYGPEGEDNLWYYNDEGKVVFTDPDTVETKRYEYSPSYAMPHYRSKEFKDIFYIETDESKLSAKEQIKRRNEKVITDTYFPVVGKPLPKFKHELSDMKTLNAISEDLDNYTWRKKFLLGEASIENEWDSYIASFKKLGVDDMITIYQKSYDAYLEWLGE